MEYLGQIDSNRPYKVQYFKSGRVQKEYWTTPGKPICIEYYEFGAKKQENWFDSLYRPYCIVYYESGAKKEEHWNKERQDGPFFIQYYESGKKKGEWWNKPSYIEYSETGEITRIETADQSS